jgi:hypothetical protein
MNRCTGGRAQAQPFEDRLMGSRVEEPGPSAPIPFEIASSHLCLALACRSSLIGHQSLFRRQ